MINVGKILQSHPENSGWPRWGLVQSLDVPESTCPLQTSSNSLPLVFLYSWGNSRLYSVKVKVVVLKLNREGALLQAQMVLCCYLPPKYYPSTITYYAWNITHQKDILSTIISIYIVFSSFLLACKKRHIISSLFHKRVFPVLVRCETSFCPVEQSSEVKIN